MIEEKKGICISEVVIWHSSTERPVDIYLFGNGRNIIRNIYLVVVLHEFRKINLWRKCCLRYK